MDYDLLKLLHQNENTFIQKSNFFLLTESILTLAYFQSSNENLFLLSLIGLISSLLWLFWGINYYRNTGKLCDDMKGKRKKDKNVAFYFEWRSKCKGGANIIIAILLPFAFVIFWGMLTFA